MIKGFFGVLSFAPICSAPSVEMGSIPTITLTTNLFVLHFDLHHIKNTKVVNIWKAYMWTAEWRIKWRMIIAVIYATFAVAERKPEKGFRLVRDLNPWPLRNRCSALPIKLTSLFVLQRSRVWILYKPATAKVAYITAMIILCLILHSAVHIYDFHIFKTSSSSFHRFITNQINNLLTVGFFA